MRRYRYGLVWVSAGGDDAMMAARVRDAIMRVNFGANLVQVVRVEKP